MIEFIQDSQNVPRKEHARMSPFLILFTFVIVIVQEISIVVDCGPTKYSMVSWLSFHLIHILIVFYLIVLI